MYKISYSPNLKWEITVSGSKNASLPIVAANYCINNKVKLLNKPNISDVNLMELVFKTAIVKSKDCFDLTDALVRKFRASILMIPFWLLEYGKVKFTNPGGCNLWKRPLDMFDDALFKAWIDIKEYDEIKEFTVARKPKANIMLKWFSVTATEALITYLAFSQNFDYDINIYQCATEPHVKNLIEFLNNAGADITLWVDHNILIKPSKMGIKKEEFAIVWDYIEAGTYFAIWAGADNAEITIKWCHVDELSAMYDIASKIWIDFKIIDKYTIKVNSSNKKNYQATKLESRIFPGFPSDLQSIFGTLMTQCDGISRIFETLYEWRFSYLTELEYLGARVEVLNPHQAIIIGKSELKGDTVTSKDLRCWAAMILAGIMAEWETNILDEEIIARWYDDVENKLINIWVKIEKI